MPTTRMLVCLLSLCLLAVPSYGQAIDRQALVERHDITFDRYTPEAPAQLGNHDFAFAFDVTGLQTFPSEAAGHIPMGCMSQWSWHAMPDAANYKYEDTLRSFNVHGRQVTYSTDMRSETATAIRSNPHRFNLARIGLRLLNEQGRAEVGDLSEMQQHVRLWTGEATSRFTFRGESVEVRTVVHPTREAIAVEVTSPLVASGAVAVEVAFAYPAAAWGTRVDDWSRPERHQSELVTNDDQPPRIARSLDATSYTVDIHTNGQANAGGSSHEFVVAGSSQSDSLQCVFHFQEGTDQPSQSLTFEQSRATAAEHWRAFWRSGGAIDLSQSSDPRWRELERRIVLSQFLTAINSAGTMPPQETGLLCNSWYGKSHLEMHWWHSAQFALWDRLELLERSIGWYDEITPAARAIAERQGYRGVRWPKMTGPHGVSSPSAVGELLIWQQPHPIYFAELAYRAKPTEVTLERYRDLVRQTADFMADYAHLDQELGQYVLGPVLIPAQECYEGLSAEGVMNPAFELAYWRWALDAAAEWSGRLGETPDPKWREVAEKIAPPHIRDGVYTAIANPPYTRRRDHPSMLAALGVMPDVGLIDEGVMRDTLADVRREWAWPDTWGWDFPMMAMTAARLGDGKAAVDLLLMDAQKNTYLKNGHNRQDDRLLVYLPGNGGLLAAVAMMAEGWDDAPETPAPGFPQDGSWTVRHEGLRRMP